MNKYESVITEEQFLEAYHSTTTKASLFRHLGIPCYCTTSNRYYDIMIKRLNLKVKSTWDGGGFKAKNTDEEFIKAVKENVSIRSALGALGLKASGANYKGFRRRVEDLNLDTSHFTGQHGASPPIVTKWDLKDILVVDSPYKGGSFALKKRLMREGVFSSCKCAICGLRGWLGKKISLHLDHINGINNDHRLENLRLLCPNCHSQTSTYAGKNKNTY